MWMRELYLRKPLLRQAITKYYLQYLYNTVNNSFTYPNLYAKSSRKRPASIVLGRGRLREPIIVSDQLQLRPLFRIPEVRFRFIGVKPPGRLRELRL